jgi:cell division protein FtsW
VAAIVNRAKHYDPVLFGLTVLATLLGLAFIFDAGYARSLSLGRGYIPGEFRQQLIYFAAGLIGYWVVVRFHADQWLKASKAIWMLSLLLLVAVEFVGTTLNGATRWINVGPINLQPAEFAKLATVIYLAGCFAERADWQTKKYKDWAAWLDATLVPKLVRCAPGFWVLFSVVLIEKEPDLGTAAVIAATAFAMFFAGGVSRKSILACFALAVVGAGLMVWKEPYRLDRIVNHNHRWDMKNVDDVGFQTVQSELGMATGSLLGVGPGAGRSKHIMPATTTDFVMATVGEEFGLLGSLFVLGAIGAIVWRLLHLARKAEKRFQMLVLFGVAGWIGIQSTVNFMMANGTLPAIGIPLPFISSGGSSLVALWLALGVCQAMLLPVPKKEEKKIAPSHQRWGNGGTRVPGTRSSSPRPGARRGTPVPRVPAGPRR